LRRLDAGDDLPRHRPSRHAADAVAHRVEVQLLPVDPRLAGTNAREPLGIEQFEAERQMVDAECDQPVVARSCPARGRVARRPAARRSS
jgi:hypothetical protein